jgi:hypothetical protein
MFCYLNYTVDKTFHRNNFWNKYDTGRYHTATDEQTGRKKIHKFWWQVFNLEEDTKNIISDLGLTGMNVYPRYSYIKENSQLRNHIDIDRIVGINFNIMADQVPCLIMKNQRFDYEACLCDVGSIMHRIDFVSHPRLILKLAIREPWEEIFAAVKKSGYIDHEKTIAVNPNYLDYKSIL